MIDYATFQKRWDKSIGEESAKKFEQWQICAAMSKWLQAHRIGAGYTEKEIADILGWEEKDVFAFEMEEAQNIYLGDLFAYLNAVGLEAGLNFRDIDTSVQDRIAYHVSQIYDLFKGLVEKAGNDQKITLEAVKFIHEYNQLMANMAVNLSSLFANQEAVIEAWKEIVPPHKLKLKKSSSKILDYDETLLFQDEV